MRIDLVAFPALKSPSRIATNLSWEDLEFFQEYKNLRTGRLLLPLGEHRLHKVVLENKGFFNMGDDFCPPDDGFHITDPYYTSLVLRGNRPGRRGEGTSRFGNAGFQSLGTALRGFERCTKVYLMCFEDEIVLADEILDDVITDLSADDVVSLSDDSVFLHGASQFGSLGGVTDEG